MLFTHQPADVGEEEPTVHVVGISISLRVLVMDSMISGPFVKIVLEEKGIALK